MTRRTEANGWRTNKERCPHCNANLQDKPVPEKYLVHDDKCTDPDKCLCLPYGKVTHFSRKIGVEIRGVYDGALFWQCPDCGGRWHRWHLPELRDKAQPYIDGKVID